MTKQKQKGQKQKIGPEGRFGGSRGAMPWWESRGQSPLAPAGEAIFCYQIVALF